MMSITPQTHSLLPLQTGNSNPTLRVKIKIKKISKQKKRKRREINAKQRKNAHKKNKKIVKVNSKREKTRHESKARRNRKPSSNKQQPYPMSGCGARKMGVMRRRPSDVLVSICLSRGCPNDYTVTISPQTHWQTAQTTTPSTISPHTHWQSALLWVLILYSCSPRYVHHR